MFLLTAFCGRLAFVITIGLSFLSYAAIAQTPPQKEPDLNRLIQEAFPVISEEINPEELFEFFFQLLNEPFDINRVTEEQLASLPLLNADQIKSFYQYRLHSGNFVSLYELQAIPGWDLNTIQNILPFLTLQSNPGTLANSFRNPTQHFFVSRVRRVLEEQRGFSPLDPDSRATTRYAGSPWQWYSRYRYARSGEFSMGFTFEKDAGETWRWAPKKHALGFDFSSFHLQLMNRGKLKNMVIGDFQVQAGQGLVMASGFSLGKGAEVIRTTFRSSLGIRPYTSVMEQGFFRGAASTYQVAKNLDATVFYARNRRDGTIGSSGKEYASEVITSFPTDGYRRTPNERSKQGNVLEQNAGFHLFYHPKGAGFQSGITLLHTGYSLPVEKRDTPYNTFEFKGKSNTLIGLHASYRWKNLHSFLETARSGSGGTGTVIGTIAALNKYLDLAILARNYERDFHTLYGNAFRENSRTINERGAYFGFRYSPNKKWQHSAYFDIFHFPGKRFYADTSSGGSGFLLHSLWRPSKTFKAHTAFQSEQKPRNNRGNNIPALPLARVSRTTALLNLEWSKATQYTLRTRIQAGRHKFGQEPAANGFAIAQDATFKLKKWEVSGRLAVFKTDNYDTRQYIFEKDVLYAFSIPSFYDHGTRHYLMVRYDVIRSLRVWVRWSQTRYGRLETIGSSLDEIQGNTRSDIKMQVMYRF